MLYTSGRVMFNDVFRYLFEGYNYLRTGKFSYIELSKLEKYQYFDLDKIQSIIDDRIMKIVNHAYKNVPFYREYYDSHGGGIRDIKTSGDCKVLPTISKSLIRNYFPDKMMVRCLEGSAI